MLIFVSGIIVGAIMVSIAVTVYSLSEMAGMYDRSIDKWFDGD